MYVCELNHLDNMEVYIPNSSHTQLLCEPRWYCPGKYCGVMLRASACPLSDLSFLRQRKHMRVLIMARSGMSIGIKFDPCGKLDTSVFEQCNIARAHHVIPTLAVAERLEA